MAKQVNIPTVSQHKGNDGSNFESVKQAIKQANADIKSLCGNKGIATIKDSNGFLAIQFSWYPEDGSSQNKKQDAYGLTMAGTIYTYSIPGVLAAKNLCIEVSQKLKSTSPNLEDRFTWDWFNKRLGKVKPGVTSKNSPIGELLQRYKDSYYRERLGSGKTVERINHGWLQHHLESDKEWLQNDSGDLPLTDKELRRVIELSKPNSDARLRRLSGFESFLKYVGLYRDFEDTIEYYKDSNKPTKRDIYIPTDKEIIACYNNKLSQHFKKGKYAEIALRYQFLYGLLATYGLRIHEAWNIANWSEPVFLSKGDWVSVTLDDSEDGDLPDEFTEVDSEKIVYPVTDLVNNPHHLICIKSDTKTGYRVAVPISPEGEDWFNYFGLNRDLFLPEISNPLKPNCKNDCTRKCSKVTGNHFKSRKLGFTAHALRHAFNHRGHAQGYNTGFLSDVLGHLPNTNTSTYYRTMNPTTKQNKIIKTLEKQQETQDKLAELQAENQNLKGELKGVKTERNRLLELVQSLQAELSLIKQIHGH